MRIVYEANISFEDDYTSPFATFKSESFEELTIWLLSNSVPESKITQHVMYFEHMYSNIIYYISIKKHFYDASPYILETNRIVNHISEFLRHDSLDKYLDKYLNDEEIMELMKSYAEFRNLDFTNATKADKINLLWEYEMKYYKKNEFKASDSIMRSMFHKEIIRIQLLKIVN